MEIGFQQISYSPLIFLFAITVFYYTIYYHYLLVIVFHRDNLAQQESGVQRAHRDREERPVTWAELDQLASGLISYLTYTSHTACLKKVINEAIFWSTVTESILIAECMCEAYMKVITIFNMSTHSSVLWWSNWRHFVFKGTLRYGWWPRYQRTSGMYAVISFKQLIHYLW